MEIKDLLLEHGVDSDPDLCVSLGVLREHFNLSIGAISMAIDGDYVIGEELFDYLGAFEWPTNNSTWDVLREKPALYEWFKCLACGLRAKYLSSVDCANLDKWACFDERGKTLFITDAPPLKRPAEPPKKPAEPPKKPAEPPKNKAEQPKKPIQQPKQKENNMSTIVDSNKAAAINAAKLKAGSVLNATAVAALKKSGAVPMMARGYLDHPLAAVLIANIASYAAQYTGNEKAKTAADLMLQAAMLAALHTIDIEGFLSSIIDNPKVLKALEGIPEAD